MSAIRNVLVVDDEPVNLDIIAAHLEGTGFTLDLVERPDQAWAKLQRCDTKYSLAILDRMMPDIDGIELMRRMKGDLRFKHMPIIIQTAAATPDQIAEGIAAGAFYYLTKPYAGEALIGVVKTAVESVEMAEQLELRTRLEAQSALLIHRAELFCTTLQDVQVCTAMIAAMCPDPPTAAIGIKELLVNAVEHGNLGITYAQKKALKLAGTWEDEIEHRAALPENRAKTVRVELERMPGLIELKITDTGQGFDWRQYLEIDHQRAFDPNGRGIAMARMVSFASVEFRGRGNEVYATLRV